MNIILSTRNPSKAEQIKQVFEGLPITILTLSEANIEGEGIEDGTTLQENALKKALFAYENINPKTWTVADDSGVFIKTLDGAPGIKSARWAGDDKTTDEITQYTLDRLADATDRSATFETVVALISPEGEQHFFTGKVEGQMLTAARVKPQPKMPYSPLFVPNGSDLTWAEMTVEEENKISHRGQAFGQMRDFLEKNIL